MADENVRLNCDAEDIDAAVEALLDVYTREEIGGLLAAKSAEIAEVRSMAAVCGSTVGYSRKNIFKNTGVSREINGITFAVNADGTVTANGTATATAWVAMPVTTPIIGRFILSGCPDGGGWSTYGLIPYKGSTAAAYPCYGGDKLGVYDGTEDSIRIRIAAGVTCDNMIFEPMLRDPRITDNTYEPYRPSIEERLAALESALNA